MAGPCLIIYSGLSQTTVVSVTNRLPSRLHASLSRINSPSLTGILVRLLDDLRPAHTPELSLFWI